MPYQLHGNVKLTPELQAAICASLRLGAYAAQAATYNGITAHTYHNWRKRGREAIEHAEAENTPIPKADAAYVEFFLATREANVAAENAHVGNIRTIAFDERAPAAARVRASTWYLERRFRERWGNTDRIEVSGPAGGEGEPVRIKMLWPEQATGE